MTHSVPKRRLAAYFKVLLLTLVVGMLTVPTWAFAGGPCPQPRKTKMAPAKFQKMKIPAGASVDSGKNLFHKSAKPMACKMCHGKEGDGNGKLGKALKPRPRNFTCSETMKEVSAGQMYWIIKNGSKGTGMAPHGKTLKDKQIWDLVKYIQSDFNK